MKEIAKRFHPLVCGTSMLADSSRFIEETNSRNRTFPPKVGSLGIKRRPHCRSKRALCLDKPHIVLVLLAVRLGRRLQPELGNISQPGEQPDVSSLRSIRERRTARTCLVHARVLGTVSVGDIVVEAVVGSSLGDSAGCRAADLDRALAVAGRRVEADLGDDRAEGSVGVAVVASSVEDEEDRIVGCVGHGKLLEGEGFAFCGDGGLVDCALDNGRVPRRGSRLESVDDGVIHQCAGLVDPSREKNMSVESIGGVGK